MPCQLQMVKEAAAEEIVEEDVPKVEEAPTAVEEVKVEEKVVTVSVAQTAEAEAVKVLAEEAVAEDISEVQEVAAEKAEAEEEVTIVFVTQLRPRRSKKMRKRTWQEIKDEAPWKQTEALKTRMEPPGVYLKPSSKSSSAKLKPPRVHLTIKLRSIILQMMINLEKAIRRR